MKEYKQLLQAISKRVKTVDKVLAASRKHQNEFVGMDFCAAPDKGGLNFGRNSLIDVTELWHFPQVSYCRKTNSTITRPDYRWEINTDFWEPSVETWNLDFYKTDLKDGNHRPVAIWYAVGETMCHYTFIYTKKELERAEKAGRKFPIALKQFELGTKKAKDHWDNDIKVPRILGDEIDAMKDEDVMVITARGWDQQSSFEIVYFNTREMDIEREEDTWDTTEGFAERIVSDLISLDRTNAALDSRY